MPNLHRGEIAGEIGGTCRRLVLTLGALAELEAAFGAEDIAALAARFGSGRLSARDLIRIIGAGLPGAGETLSDEDVARLTVPDGAAGYVRAPRRGLAGCDLRGRSHTGSRGRAPSLVAGAARIVREPFPWARMIGLGLGVLRLSSDSFWRMTPRELGLALRAVLPQQAPPITRASFAALCARFPDQPS